MKNRVYKINDLNYPSSDKIQSRTSTVARSMASTLMPRIGASDHDIKFFRKYFNTDKCVYCGNKATHLDHLFPLIENQKPTGYCTNPANLVPCCSECNGSKGSKRWWDYMDTSSYDDSDVKQKKIKERLTKDNQLQNRSTNLKNYCEEMGLPTCKDSNNNDSCKLNLNKDCLDWWNELYDNIKNALDTAQIQIDAFNAGITTSISGDNIDFKKYFKNLFKDKKYKDRLTSIGFDEKKVSTDDNNDELKKILDDAEKAFNLGKNNAESILGKDNDKIRELYNTDEKWLKYIITS